MADVNNNIDFTARFDDSAITAGINRMVDSVERGQSEFKDLGDAQKTAFADVGNAIQNSSKAAASGLETMRAKLKQIPSDIESVKRENIELRKELLRVENAYKKTNQTGSDEAKKLKKQMDVLRGAIKANSIELAELNSDKTNFGKLIKDTQNAGGQIKLTANEARNLSFQFEDLAVQIGSGQGLFRPLLQQGPQIVQVFGGVSNTFRFFGQQILGAVKSAATLKNALKFTGIGLIVAVILSIVAALSKMESVTRGVGQAAAFIGGAFDALVGRFAKFGGAIIGLVTGQKSFSEASKEAGQAVTGLGSAMLTAGNAAARYKVILQDAQKTLQALDIEESNNQKRLIQLQAVVDDTGKSYGKRKQAAIEAAALEGRVNRDRIEELSAIVDVERKRNLEELQRGKRVTAVDEAEKKLNDELANGATLQISLEQTLKGLRDEQIQKAREAAEKQRELVKDLASEYKKLLDLISAAELDALVDEARIVRQGELAIQVIDEFETQLKAKYKELNKTYDAQDEFDKLRGLASAKTQKELLDFRLEQAAQALEKERQLGDESRENELAAIQRRLDLLGKYEEIELTRIEGINRAGQDEKKAEEQKEREILAVKKSFLEQRLLLIKELYGEDSPEVQLILAQIEQIKTGINSIGDKETLTLFDKIKGKLIQAFDIDEQQFEKLADIASGAFQNFISGLDALTQAQITQQERVVSAIEERINKTEELLSKEEERQEQGYANNVDALRTTLAAQQAEREAATAKQQELERKAAKQRLLVNSLQQVSNLALAASAVIADSAKLGFVGVLTLGIAGVAAIFSIIAQAKAQAAQFGAIPEFREGTPYLDGKGTGTSDSNLVKLSRGERVVPAAMNDEIGGRQLSNSEMVRLFKVGQAAESANFSFLFDKTISRGKTDALASIVPQILKDERKKEALQVEIQYGTMGDAYERAAMKSADRMIAYWQSRPVRKVEGTNEVLEWQEGGTKFRQNIENE